MFRTLMGTVFEIDMFTIEFFYCFTIPSTHFIHPFTNSTFAAYKIKNRFNKSIIAVLTMNVMRRNDAAMKNQSW